jgi:hypothetical protein
VPDWTEDEARAYLPRLRLLLRVIRRASHLAVNARGNGHARLPGSNPASDAGSGTGTAGSGTGAAGSAAAAAAAADAGSDEETPELPVTFDAQDALAEIEEKGIVLRDAERGLIDFPARHPGGREVLLCWQLGEDDLAWWHLPEDGFAGRRPLPMPPEL